MMGKSWYLRAFLRQLLCPKGKIKHIGGFVKGHGASGLPKFVIQLSVLEGGLAHLTRPKKPRKRTIKLLERSEGVKRNATFRSPKKRNTNSTTRNSSECQTAGTMRDMEELVVERRRRMSLQQVPSHS
jgi:hypothetical protein